jgi:hypothetical protein
MPIVVGNLQTATIDPATMLAFWLVGFEADSPDDSGEICVVELFGDSISTTTSDVSVGVKAHHDRRLHDDMARVPLNLDASDWNTYSAKWTEQGVSFFVDDDHIRTVAQRIAYPTQVMLDLFEFRRDGPVDPPDTRRSAKCGRCAAHAVLDRCSETPERSARRWPLRRRLPSATSRIDVIYPRDGDPPAPAIKIHRSAIGREVIGHVRLAGSGFEIVRLTSVER